MRKILSIFLLVIWVIGGTSAYALAKISDYIYPKLSITFDDGYLSNYEKALPILESHNLKATAFIVPNWIGQTEYMSWAQVQSLQNQYGWEIGSHTLNHPELPLLPVDQIKAEVENSKTTLESQGFNISSFATPLGAYDNKTLIEILKNYNLHRGFWDRDTPNGYPVDRSVMTVQSIERGVTAANVTNWINEAIANNKWLTLVIHDIKPASDPNDEYVITESLFTQVADAIKNSGIKVVPLNSTLQKPGPNLITNSSFSNGLSDGWRTDAASNVILDANNMGSYPSATQSVQISGSSTAAHLFSSPIPTNPIATYSLETFVNADALTAGELGYYLDEYDTNNNWISGQWIGKVNPKTVKYFTYLYHPTSSAVSSFSVQTYLTANATGKAYLDNFEVYNLDPGPVAVPDTINLVSNGSFENLTDGWPTDWKKDSEFFTLDAASQGNDGTNSLTLAPNSAYAHLFSAPITVDSASSYVWSQYLKSASTGGEFGFYIDEYDANGAWISGQWKGMLEANYTGTKIISYTPSSTQVKSASLQYYATPGSAFTLTLDSVNFAK